MFFCVLMQPEVAMYFFWSQFSKTRLGKKSLDLKGRLSVLTKNQNQNKYLFVQVCSTPQETSLER